MVSFCRLAVHPRAGVARTAVHGNPKATTDVPSHGHARLYRGHSPGLGRRLPPFQYRETPHPPGDH